MYPTSLGDSRTFIATSTPPASGTAKWAINISARFGIR